jgi:hypothetical protein
MTGSVQPSADLVHPRAHARARVDKKGVRGYPTPASVLVETGPAWGRAARERIPLILARTRTHACIEGARVPHPPELDARAGAWSRGPVLARTHAY